MRTSKGIRGFDSSRMEALFMMDEKTRALLTEIEGAEKEIKYHKGKVKEYSAEKEANLLELMRRNRQEKSGQGDLFDESKGEDIEKPESAAEEGAGPKDEDPGEPVGAGAPAADRHEVE
jgi:hypothetical protein